MKSLFNYTKLKYSKINLPTDRLVIYVIGMIFFDGK